jgi:hypothetical protein
VNTNNRRKDGRVRLVQEGILHANGKLIAKCTVRDVSVKGARLQLHEPLEPPAEFTLTLTRQGTVRRQCQVMWSVNDEIGVLFLSE